MNLEKLTPNELDPRLSRRRLLQVGGVGTLGLALPDLLRADAVGGDAKRPGGKSCIFIFQYGGLSQLDSWDPKPNGPQEIRGPYKPIATATPGFQVGELMPQLAQRSERFAVIRSLSHSVPIHDVANRMLLAGRSLPPLDSPAFGSIVTKLRPSIENVPSYVWLQKFGGGAMPPEATYVTGGFLGMAHAPLVIGHGHADNPATAGFRVTALDTAAEVPLDRLAARRELLGRLQADGIDGNRGTDVERARLSGTAAAQTMHRFQERAFDLLHGPQAKQAFEIERESDSDRDRYGRNPLGQNLLMARRLIEAGTRLVSVVAWTGIGPTEKFTSVETWDMHGNAGISIFDNGWNGLGFALPRCDQAVAALLDDLTDRGLLDSTLVVLVGEFGRTPRISKGASAIGRDHWPNCYSAMLAGAGIRGGAVYGESDHQAAYVKDKPVSLEDFTATLLAALDIDPATRISPDGFTKPASPGQPISELLPAAAIG